MSGIVGICHRNGAPLNRALLQSLCDSLAFRGPDAREIWIEGPIGFAHTMLRTARESTLERQPASLEERYWIVADGRIDDRAECLTALKRSGRNVSSDAPDAAILLHAYAAWGTPCVERLKGDFSFAIWDARNKHLFCARDHFGVVPFYFLQKGDFFIFSNTLNCLRLHPRVSSELNELAVGDFLLFGVNCDNATTTFRDIQRLPPGHSLSVSLEGVKVRRYWSPPTDGYIRCSKPQEYVEGFQSVLRAAVSDRLRTDRVGLLLSGGLDSSAIAATVKEVSAIGPGPTDIRCFTHVYETLIPDQEGEFAAEVGEFLRLPVKLLSAECTQLFEGWPDGTAGFPEPLENPMVGAFLNSYRNISSQCRVLLSGEGCDNLMEFQMWPYVRDLRRRGEWRRLLSDVGNYLWVRPFPWRGIQSRFLKIIGRGPNSSEFPQWLAPDFVRRNKLEDRWKEWGEHPKMTFSHPIHTLAHASLSWPYWTQMFELENAGVSHQPLEMRYPFLDLRVVNYLLAIPPFPWFFQKTLVRESMSGRIPERIRTRPKSPLQGDPLLALVKKGGAEKVKQMHWSNNLDRIIDRSAIVPAHDKMTAEEICANLRPYCFNIWLQSASGLGYNMQAEAGNG